MRICVLVLCMFFVFISYCFNFSFNFNLGIPEVQIKGIIFAIFLKKTPDRYLG